MLKASPKYPPAIHRAFQQFGAYVNALEGVSTWISWMELSGGQWIEREGLREEGQETECKQHGKIPLQFNVTHGQPLDLLNSMSVEKPLEPIPKPYCCLALYAKRFVFN